MKVLVIIPAYNEEYNIEKTVDALVAACPAYDYVIVNDSSSDATEAICKKRKYSYLSLPINLGIGGGVQAGYQYAKENGYDVAVQLDGDGQHNPSYIEMLLQPLRDEMADMVIGSRFIEKKGFQTSTMRRIGISIIRIVVKLCCNTDVTDTTSGFRAVNRRLIELFAHMYAQDYPEPESIVVAGLYGYRVQEVPVEMNARISGVSSIDALHSIYYMIKVFLSLLVTRISIHKRRKAR